MTEEITKSNRFVPMIQKIEEIVIYSIQNNVFDKNLTNSLMAVPDIFRRQSIINALNGKSDKSNEDKSKDKSQLIIPNTFRLPLEIQAGKKISKCLSKEF